VSIPKPTSKTSWAWAISTTIVSLFISLFLSFFPFLELNIKAAIVLSAFSVWILILVAAYLMDREERKWALLREISEEDVFLKEWIYCLKIQADGSATLRRQIHGRNFAVKRRNFEFQSWTDPEKNASHEKALKKIRKMITDVTVIPKGKGPIRVFASKSVKPTSARRVNRLVHSVPLTDPPSKPEVKYLNPNDEFIIVINDRHQANTWKRKGDEYTHLIRYPHELLHIEITFPRNWAFPEATIDNVVGYVKSPTTAKWERTDEQPENAGQHKFVWEIRYPRLLHTYKLAYSRMVIPGERSSNAD